MLSPLQVQQLKAFLGHEVVVAIHATNTIVDLPPEETSIEKQITIKFLGVYGVDGMPFFVFGSDASGCEVAWRNVSWSTATEETGIENFRHASSIISIGDVDVSEVFKAAAQEVERHGNSRVMNLLGYRPEIVQGQLVRLNWGTSMDVKDAAEIAEIKTLEKII